MNVDGKEMKNLAPAGPTGANRETDVESAADILRERSVVIEIANSINSRLDLGQILSTIVTEFSKILDFDIGCVAIYEKNDYCLYLKHIYRKNGDKSGEGRYVALDESNVIGWVAINRKPVLRADIESDSRFSEIMKEDNLQSDIVVPLLAKGALIGTVNFGRITSRCYTEADLRMVEDFSTLISIAIEKSQLFDELKELGDKYRNLMRSANDLIMLLDVSGDIVECNDAVRRIFGYGKEEVLGKSPSEFAPPPRKEIVRVNFGKVLRGELKKAIEVPYLHKNGETVYLDVNVNVIRIKDHPYIIAVGHDVTDRKILEEKITFQNRELKSSNRKLLEVDRLKSEFLGRISHELRTPLSIIMAYAGTLLDDREIDTDTSREFLKVIEDQSNKLLSLINDLLDLSKVEVSETMLNITESSINEMIRVSVAIARPMACQKGVEIVTDMDINIPITRFDPLRIRQICVNLLNNAIKYTSHGGTIKISSRIMKDNLLVSVTDRGPGIDPDHISRIFDNFTQIDGGAARTQNGMGIGLGLVRHYVELHHGKIWVESKKGEGSIFSFSLPLMPCELSDRIENTPVPGSC